MGQEAAVVQVGNAGADRLLHNARTVGENIREQAKALAALSHAALVAVESPVTDTIYFPGGWPLTSAKDLEELLLSKAMATINPTEETETESDPLAALNKQALCKHTYYDLEMRGTYTPYGDVSGGYPPTGFSQDLIKWSDELAQSGWAVLAQLDRASDNLGRNQFDVYVYPENEQTKELLDQKTTIQEKYKASQWLSERVLMYAYGDEFGRFDWTGDGVPREQTASSA